MCQTRGVTSASAPRFEGPGLGDSPVVRIRPRRTRVVAWVAAVVIALASVGLAAALEGRIGSGPEVFGPADRVALIGLGLIAAAAVLTLARPSVEADDEGVRVRNIVGSYALPWSAVRAVRYEHGASWATLELTDDELLGVMAVQAVDKEHAVAAVRALRELHAAHQRRNPG